MKCPVAQREESIRRDVRRRPTWILETWPPLVKVSCSNDVDVYVSFVRFKGVFLPEFMPTIGF
jgi:hypothetical protein